jgi:hypothetical protein
VSRRHGSLLFRRKQLFDLLCGVEQRLLLLLQGVDLYLGNVSLLPGNRRQAHNDNEADHRYQKHDSGQRPWKDAVAERS